MRQAVREFVRFCAANLPLVEPVYDFGSRQVPGGGDCNMRPLFPGKRFVGADIHAGPGVDAILDLHAIDLPAESVGTILILDTLEHVEFPRKAMAEVQRVLKHAGVLIMTSVLCFRIHSEPDYWRFTPAGFRSLLADFPHSAVAALGDSRFPHTVLGVALEASADFAVMRKFETALENWRSRQ